MINATSNADLRFLWIVGQPCATYLAALDANRAQNPEVQIEQSSEVEVVFPRAGKCKRFAPSVFLQPFELPVDKGYKPYIERKRVTNHAGRTE